MQEYHELIRPLSVYTPQLGTEAPEGFHPERCVPERMLPRECQGLTEHVVGLARSPWAPEVCLHQCLLQRINSRLQGNAKCPM